MFFAWVPEPPQFLPHMNHPSILDSCSPKPPKPHETFGLRLVLEHSGIVYDSHTLVNGLHLAVLDINLSGSALMRSILCY